MNLCAAVDNSNVEYMTVNQKAGTPLYIRQCFPQVAYYSGMSYHIQLGNSYRFYVNLCDINSYGLFFYGIL